MVQPDDGLLLPNIIDDQPAIRTKWLADAAAGFVTSSSANREIYSLILEALWPAGHGIPGPHVSKSDIRLVIDANRAMHGKPPYVDPCRRVRELQGEEGFYSIITAGSRYQLQNLIIGPKRQPRMRLSDAAWHNLKQQYNNRCANCGKSETVKLSPDHKIPRERGGGNDISNYQPLCYQCNNDKSNTCRGCKLNCGVCPWAFPENFKHIIIDDTNKEFIRQVATEKGAAQLSDIVNEILRLHFAHHFLTLPTE